MKTNRRTARKTITRHKEGLVWILVGVLLMASAFGLIAFNSWEDGRAGKRAESAAEQLAKTMPEASQASSDGEVIYPDYVLNPNMDMPVRELHGQYYIGLLDIPAIGASLPVQQEWSYPNMKVSPCRYTGSAYLNNMVICAHNYQTHFGKLEELCVGDAVYFTDMDGNKISFKVKEIDTLASDAVHEMVFGGWDLTLFTCTIDGGSRVTVRCSKSASEPVSSMGQG